MPTVNIGNTDKRMNSTKQTFTTAHSLSCRLKEPTGMANPTFIVSGLTKGALYNYCSFEGRYYWIDNIVYLTNNVEEVHCHLDPLATYKSSILNTEAMVVYGDSANWNQFTDDVRFQPEVWNATNTKFENIFPFELDREGCIILTFTQTASVDWMQPSTHVLSACGIHTGIISWDQFRACLGDLTTFSNTVPSASAVTNIGEACMEIVQAFARSIQSTSGASLMDNIKRCIWVPFKLSDLINKTGATLRQGLMLGGVLASNTIWYETSNTAVTVKSGTLAPDIDAVTDSIKFLRNKRFTSVQLVTPGGYAQIPNDIFLYPSAQGNQFHYKSSICIADGSWALKLSSSLTHADTLAAFSGNLGVNLMGTIYDGPTTSSMVGDAVTGITKLALTMGVSSAIGGLASGAMQKYSSVNEFSSYQANEESAKTFASGISGMIPQTGLHASAPSGDFGGSACSLFLGGASSDPGDIYLVTKNYAPKMIVDDPTTYAAFCDIYGYPVNKFMALSNISGYCQCAGASVKASGASEASKSTINSFLNSGLYIE